MFWAKNFENFQKFKKFWTLSKDNSAELSKMHFRDEEERFGHFKKCFDNDAAIFGQSL